MMSNVNVHHRAIGETTCVLKNWFQRKRVGGVASLSSRRKSFGQESRKPLSFLAWSAVLWSVCDVAVVDGAKIPSSAQAQCT